MFRQIADASDYIKDIGLSDQDERYIKRGIKRVIKGERKSYFDCIWDYYEGNLDDKDLKKKGIKFITYENQDKSDQTKTIYKIVNKITGEMYIGTTSKSLTLRFVWHRREYKKNLHRKLYQSMDKYGTDNFYIEEIEKVSYNSGYDREEYWINKLDTYKNGLNETNGGRGPSTNPRNVLHENKEQILKDYQELKKMKPILDKYGIKRYEYLKEFLINNGVLSN